MQIQMLKIIRIIKGSITIKKIKNRLIRTKIIIITKIKIKTTINQIKISTINQIKINRRT